MNKETEALRVKMVSLVRDCPDGASWYDLSVSILQACKEAGLKFVPKTMRFPEVELPDNIDEIILTIQDQIKEIDI